MREASRVPSPALVVAILALIAATAGAAVAQPAAKKVTTKKVKKIADKEIAKKAPGLSVANAANATKAANADQLGGVPAGDYQTRIRWAIVKDDGTITAQSGGISNSVHDPATCNPGCDFLNFGSSQANKSIMVTPNTLLPAFAPKTQVSAGLCGGTGNPGGISCSPPGTNDTSHILVQTGDQTGAGTHAPYYVAVIG